MRQLRLGSTANIIRSPGSRALEHRRRRYALCGIDSRPLTAAYTTTDSGAQPLTNDDGTVSLAVNGEIYNHRVLRKQLKTPYNFKTHSDCEVIIPLVWRKGTDVCGCANERVVSRTWY